MINYFKKAFIIIVFFVNSNAYALSSSSYLIANSAINLYDFDKANIQFSLLEEDLRESDLHNKLLTLINLQLISEANLVAKQIINIDTFNQEAWIVYLINSKIKNNSEPFNEYNKIKSSASMDLLNYIFFSSNGNLNDNNIIADLIYEVVYTSSSQNQVSDKFLLFYLSIAVMLNPNFNEAYFYSAQIYQRLKNYEKAEFFFKKIDNKHNLYVDSQKFIAINMSKLGLFSTGEEKLKKLIFLYPNKTNLIIALADLYRIEKKYEDAINFYTKVISSQTKETSDLWKILYLRGVCYERLNKWNFAEKDFLQSLKVNPNSAEVLNYLAYGWLERNQKLNVAVEMLHKAYTNNPESYHILDSLAWAYFKKKNFNKALELMEQVIILAPGEAISLDHLADIYFAINRKREAVYFWQQAKDLSEPEDGIFDQIEEKIKKYYER